MKESAGIVVRLKNKLLLCRPTNKIGNTKNDKLWGPPKGGINIGEIPINAAIRETFEEIGIKIDIKQIKKQKPILIEYKNKKEIVYKKVYLFLVDIESPNQIGLSDEILPSDMLQLDEVDSAYFMDKLQASQKIFHRFESLLELI